MTGNSAANTLNGAAGNDTLIGGVGNDSLTGSTGNDSFYFAPGFGKDIVSDFTAGAGTPHDTMHVDLGVAFDTFADVMAVATQVVANTVLTFDANDTITLNNVLKTGLVVDDFVFG